MTIEAQSRTYTTSNFSVHINLIASETLPHLPPASQLNYLHARQNDRHLPLYVATNG